jgi:hypothetical protein
VEVVAGVVHAEAVDLGEVAEEEASGEVVAIVTEEATGDEVDLEEEEVIVVEVIAADVEEVGPHLAV